VGRIVRKVILVWFCIEVVTDMGLVLTHEIDPGRHDFALWVSLFMRHDIPYNITQRPCLRRSDYQSKTPPLAWALIQCRNVNVGRILHMR
jgi:hypothetical protein